MLVRPSIFLMIAKLQVHLIAGAACSVRRTPKRDATIAAPRNKLGAETDAGKFRHLNGFEEKEGSLRKKISYSFKN